MTQNRQDDMNNGSQREDMDQNRQGGEGNRQGDRGGRQSDIGNRQGGRQIDDNQDDMGRDVNNPDDMNNDINDVSNKRGNAGGNERSRM